MLHKIAAYQHSFGQGVLSEEQQEKKELGFKCRQIMDVGRILFLQQKGYNVGLIRYCSQEQSGEQWLLWAKK